MSVVSTVIAVASAVYTRYRQKKAEKKAKEEADKRKGFEIAVEGQIGNLGLVYGRAKVAGIRVFHGVKSTYTYADTADLKFLTSGDSRLQQVAITSFPVTGLSISVYDSGSGYLAEPPEGVLWTAENTHTETLAISPGTELFRASLTSTLTITIVQGRNDLFLPGAFVQIQHPPLNFLNYFGIGGFDPFLGYTPLPNLYDFEGNIIDGNTPVANTYKILSYDNASGLLTLENPLTTGGTAVTGTATGALGANSGGKRREYLFVNQAICVDGIEQILACSIDDKDFRDYSFKASGRVHAYRNGGVVDPMMLANYPDQATATFPETAHASMVFKLDRDDPQYSGVPNVAFYVEGREVRAPITEMAGVYTLSAEKIYSNNPVYVLLDYMMDPTYGMGLSIDQFDLESFYLAAQIAERKVYVNGQLDIPIAGTLWAEKIALGTTSRQLSLYEFNGVLDTSKTVRENINIIMETMEHAFLVWSDGTYKLNLMYPTEYDPAETYAPGEIVQYPPGASSNIDLYRALVETNAAPSEANLGTIWEKGPKRGLTVAYLTDDDLILSGETSFKWPSLRDKLNHCTVRFLNESKDFEEDSVSWPAKYPTDPSDVVYATYLSEDNNIKLENEVFRDGITTVHHAKAVAEELVRSSRAETNYQMTISSEHLYLEPGDVIQVSSTLLGIPGELIQIETLRINSEGDLEVSGSKFDCRHFAWNAPDDEVVTGRNPYATEKVGQASGLSFTPTSSSDLNPVKSGVLTWVAAPGTGVISYEVKIINAPSSSILPGAAWQDIGTTSGTALDIPLMVEGLYTLTVVAVTEDGVKAPEFDMATGSRWPLLQVVIGADYFLTRTAVVQIFKASTSNLAGVVPTGGSYDFDTGVLTPPTGYYLTPQEAQSAASGEVYYAQARARVTLPEIVDSALVWTPLSTYFTQLQSKDLVAYYRYGPSGTNPLKPTDGTGSWTFPSGPFVVPTGNVTWSASPPPGEGTLYETKAIATRNGSYGPNTNTLIWSTPAVSLIEGPPGYSPISVNNTLSNYVFVEDVYGNINLTEYLGYLIVSRDGVELSYTQDYSAVITYEDNIDGTIVAETISAGLKRARLTVSSWGNAFVNKASFQISIVADGDVYISNVYLFRVPRGFRGYAAIELGNLGATIAEKFADDALWVSPGANSAAISVATAAMALTSDGFLRPLDRITVYDEASGISATRLFEVVTNNPTAVLPSHFSSKVTQVIDGSLIVNGTIGADKLVTDSAIITGTAQIGVGLVDTLRIKGNSVIVPVVTRGGFFRGLDPYEGNTYPRNDTYGTFAYNLARQVVNRGVLLLDYPGIIYVTFIAGQGFGRGPRGWEMGFRIYINGVMTEDFSLIGGSAFEDAPVMAHSFLAPAGTVIVEALHYTQDNTVVINYSQLHISGAKN